ncbi:carbohydrate-binding domain-containing protein [Geofilum sp. OHC36d9]|uniref:carbohydrate-binding domain-containing protein n=1 Tax=Geofilum sp. OHC36d9 TaxID=3458413 RepID=UPI00403440AD
MKATLYFWLVAGLFISAGFWACTDDGDNYEDDTSGTETTVDPEGSEDTADDALVSNSESHEEASDYVYTDSDIVDIALEGTSALADGAGVSVSGSIVTIESAGVYRVTGTLTNGQLVIDAGDDDVVRIILNGTDITCSNSAAVFVDDCKKAIFMLAEGTNNQLTDGASYVFEADDDEPNAAFFSKENMSVAGSGSLTVTGNYNDAINCKDGLVINGATITVNAVDDGIRGKDYLIVKESSIVVNSTGDGFKSDNDADSACGYILIESGDFNINAGGDGLAAETDVIVADGSFNIVTGGGSSYSYNSDNSMKGIKGGTGIIIDGGIFTIQTADDAIHSNGTVAINGGTYDIASGDDGVHADVALGINGGDMIITKSYEGLESAVITFNSGSVHLVASDDGVNAAGGSDNSSQGRPGAGNFSSSGDYYLYIKGGYLVVNAGGDGLDANGTIEMSGGTVIVNGPTSSGNGVLDYNDDFKLTGGTLIAAGIADMPQTPGSASTQCSLTIAFDSSLSAGTLFHLETAGGDEVVTFEPSKRYQLVTYSSPLLVKGTSYSIYYGGSATGEQVDGLVTDGVYTPGNKYDDYTQSQIVTSINVRSGF